MSNDKFEWTDELVRQFGERAAVRYSHERMHLNKGFNPKTSWLGIDEELKQFKREQLSKCDWEIVSFTAFDGKKYHNLNGINSWIANGDVITSVRRLSDGEVFSVGDEVELFGNRKITKIEVINNELLFVLDAQNKVHIGNLRKAKKQVLFTDEQKQKLIDIINGL